MRRDNFTLKSLIQGVKLESMAQCLVHKRIRYIKDTSEEKIGPVSTGQMLPKLSRFIVP